MSMIKFLGNTATLNFFDFFPVFVKSFCLPVESGMLLINTQETNAFH